MKQSEKIDAVAVAYCKAQTEIEGAKKDSLNPHFKSKYADLSACWDACRKALADNSLSVLQGNAPGHGGVVVSTRILHSSGQWIEDEGLFVPAPKQDPHGYGSALTYARRYSLCSMMGISPEDDDGNAGVKGIEDKKKAEAQAIIDAEAAKKAQEAQYLADHLKACEVHKDSVSAIVEGITMGNLSKAAEAWCELDEMTQRQLWFAPTKGGKAFTTKEREIIKSTEFREAAKPFLSKE